MGVGASPPFYQHHVKYTYSAASVAIRLLQNLPSSARKHLRKMVLLEDHEAVAYPDCHGRGFIFYCLENSKLRIQRTVSLWSNAFPIEAQNRYHYTWNIRTDRIPSPPEYLSADRLFASSVSISVGKWIAETLLLRSLGMPKDAYTLVLDGSPLSARSAEVFQVVRRDAAWQTTLDLCYARSILPEPSWYERRLRLGYMYEDFSVAISGISRDSSPIRCNFDPGAPCDPEAIVRAREKWSAKQWEEDWDTHEPASFQTESPLPPWHVLRWRRVIP